MITKNNMAKIFKVLLLIIHLVLIIIYFMKKCKIWYTIIILLIKFIGEFIMDKEKKKYIFLISIVVIGVIIGIIFSNILSDNDKILVEDKLTTYFMNIKENKEINYLSNFLNSFLNNNTTLVLIWIFGLSIIGLFFNIFILFFKSFAVGFGIGSIINLYLYKGILGSILYVFPHILINLFVFLVLVYYANNFSSKLFKLLFLKKDVKFNLVMKKYLKILLYGFILLVVSSLLETFLSPFIMKLFTFLID